LFLAAAFEIIQIVPNEYTEVDPELVEKEKQEKEKELEEQLKEAGGNQ